MSVGTVQRDHTAERFALSIGGKVYGPYTAQQMKAYVAEGRITPASLISREAGTWVAAGDDPFCAEWLAAATQTTSALPAATVSRPDPLPAAAASPTPSADARPPAANAREAFLRELEGVRLKTPAFGAGGEPRAAASPVRPQNTDPAPPHAERIVPASEHASANMTLVFDLKSRGHGKLEEDIMSIGPATKVMSGVWILHTSLSATTVRNQLIKHFGAIDSFFIVDATRDRTTWFNLGPEIDAHIRRVWRRS
jgi:hypothetical protein